MADVYWPGLRASPQLLVPANVRLDPQADNTSGGLSFSGSEQVIGNTPGRWKLSLFKVHISSPQEIGLWTAIERALRGRSKTVGMPVYEYTRAPWPIVNGKKLTTYGSIPFTDGSLFTDGSGFTQDVIIAYTVGDTPSGSMSCAIQMQYGSALQGYETFGFSEKVYGIDGITNVDNSGQYPIYSVTFWPPCRADIPAGSQLEFDDPVLRCRLATDDAMNVKDGLELHRHAAPDLVLYEDL